MTQIITQDEKIHPVIPLINQYADQLLKMIVDEKKKVGNYSNKRIALNTLEKAILEQKRPQK